MFLAGRTWSRMVGIITRPSMRDHAAHDMREDLVWCISKFLHLLWVLSLVHNIKEKKFGSICMFFLNTLLHKRT